VAIAKTGRTVQCPCCGWRFRHFAPYIAPDRLCWRCGALERHRSTAIYLDRHPELTRDGMTILHVAPEPTLRARLTRIPAVHYIGGDLTGEFGADRIDVTRLRFPDETFDAVVCNHVLEHVPDDRRAMREIARVLKPRGWALLLVPDLELRAPTETTDEDPAVTDPAERLRRFGQRDHVRTYGWDYLDRLRDAGLIARVEWPHAFESESEIARFRLRKRGAVEPIIICRRA
jgi:SAM-dependent methyltransferase